jgi:hypothetical protein
MGKQSRMALHSITGVMVTVDNMSIGERRRKDEGETDLALACESDSVLNAFWS